VSGPPLIPVVDEGLGNTAYLLDLGDGRALAVDPPRDLRALRAAARRAGLVVAYAADTHLHADFLSGARQLAATDGAAILASAAGDRAFDHVGLRDGDEVDLGGLRLWALATAGHTHEHLAFLLLDGATPLGVFTGGSLIVGAAARTDLLGPEHTEPFARAQYRSMQRLLALPDTTGVWPTHGAGSFCSAPPTDQRTSTIGEQKATNPLLDAPDEDAFVTRLLAGLGSYPAYFTWLAEVNRRGPALLGAEPLLREWDVAGVRQLVADGAAVLDVRPVGDFAAGHLPGAISIPLRAQFATWLGWLLPPDTPLVVIRNPDQHPGDILWPALNIGYEQIRGELAGGVGAWTAAGGQLRRIPLVAPEDVDPGRALDIRQDGEYQAGHLPGARHVVLSSILSNPTAQKFNDRTIFVCEVGERSSVASEMAVALGVKDVVNFRGGHKAWREAGLPLEKGI